MKLTLQDAQEVIAAAEEKAKQLNVKMVISVVDDGGNMIAVHRMDDAWLASVDIAQKKAWTSVALKTKTADLAEATVPNAELYGLNTTNDGRIVLFGGGIPLKHGETIVGAIGVSGSSVEDDVTVAEAGVYRFDDHLEKAGM
ncbi:heme-binding protein [Shouchella sp. JSM 1781072]|uniref:GlcG/HbpS family heme-binding protein n=1 Tax=Shouchella sp. JSM 1781072 TaxID=3344581 RepID=UPI0035BF0554